MNQNPIIRILTLAALTGIIFATFGLSTCKKRPAAPQKKAEVEVVAPALECEAPPAHTAMTISYGGEIKLIKLALGESVEVICDERGKLLDIRRAKNTVASAESLMDAKN